MKSLSILFSFIILSVVAQGQNLKKAFKYLNDNDFDRSKVIFDEATGIAEMATIAHYGIALIYSNKSYRSRDLYMAFDEIIKAQQNFDKVDASLMGKVDDYFSGLADIKKKRDEIEAELRQKVIDANTIEATKEFLKKANQSAYANEIKTLYAKQSFQQAMEYNTINAYEDYIKEFPTAKEVASAKQKIYALAYEDVVKANTLEALNGFVAKYPTAPQVEGAKSKIIQKEYEMVLMTGTDDAFDRFIQKYPETKQSEELKAKQLQMNYIQAKQLNTVSVYNNFLRKYPASPFAAELMPIRDSLAFEEARNKNTIEAYKDFINNYPNAKQVAKVMAIQKDLSYSKSELAALKAKEKFTSRNIYKVEYLKINTTDTNKRTISKTILYDAFGNAVKISEISLVGAKINIVRNFSENGRNLLKETKTIDGKTRYEVNYYYNEKDLLDSARRECFLPCEDGLPVGSYLFEYVYNNRNIKKVSIINKDGSYSKISNYTYNNQKLIAQELMEITEKGVVKNLKINYQYDFFDHLIQKTTFSGENDISAVETYFYNKAGDVTKFSSYDAFGKIRKSNHYDATGLLSTTDVEYPNDALANHTIVYKYFYKNEK